MTNLIVDATRSAVANAGVPEKDVTPLTDLLFDLLDRSDAETLEELLVSEIDTDDYYDFLYSWDAGHRRFRKWISETEVGCPVKLTKEGRRVCRLILSIPEWANVFSSN